MGEILLDFSHVDEHNIMTRGIETGLENYLDLAIRRMRHKDGVIDQAPNADVDVVAHDMGQGVVSPRLRIRYDGHLPESQEIELSTFVHDYLSVWQRVIPLADTWEAETDPAPK